MKESRAATFGYREIHLQFKIYPGKGTIFHFSKLANYNFLAHNEKAKKRKVGPFLPSSSPASWWEAGKKQSYLLFESLNWRHAPCATLFHNDAPSYGGTESQNREESTGRTAEEK